MNQISLQLIVGLGNPDKKLLTTRHNVGFWFLDMLSDRIGKKFIYSKKYDADIFEYEYSSKIFQFFKPMSYINNSGVPIKKFIKNKIINPENILVIYDDLDLTVGKIRLKQGGGSWWTMDSYDDFYFYNFFYGSCFISFFFYVELFCKTPKSIFILPSMGFCSSSRFIIIYIYNLPRYWCKFVRS